MATPAAPAPAMTTYRSSIRLSTIFSAFSSAASVTTAVPCWSSWKTGMSRLLPQPLLDLEARRGGDVLEVDAAEDRGDALDGLDDLLGGLLDVEADREGVDAGELLEQQRLALHHRQGGLGADVAQAQHGGAVGDDGHGVALDRQLVDPGRLLGDGQADPGHAGRVGHRQVVAVADRPSESTSILPPSCMAKVRSSHSSSSTPSSPLDGVEDLLLVGLVDAVDDHVLVEHGALHLEALEAPDVGAGLADGDGEAAEHAGHVVQQHPQAHREGGVGERVSSGSGVVAIRGKYSYRVPLQPRYARSWICPSCPRSVRCWRRRCTPCREPTSCCSSPSGTGSAASSSATATRSSWAAATTVR